MSNESPSSSTGRKAHVLANSASALGAEILDISGFLELVDAQSEQQTHAIHHLSCEMQKVDSATSQMLAAGNTLIEATDCTQITTKRTLDNMRDSDVKTHLMATFMQTISERTDTVRDTVEAMRKNNQQIVGIARHVNMLAINAKIEASRAGETGRGFTTVAEAINELALQTTSAAAHISENLETVTTWIGELAVQAKTAADQANGILNTSADRETDLRQMENRLGASAEAAQGIVTEAAKVHSALEALKPSLSGINTAADTTRKGVSDATQRVHSLIDTSESIVQNVSALGINSNDAPLIEKVQILAGHVAQVFEAAVRNGQISQTDLFDSTYTPIAHTDPPQFMAPFTQLTDWVLPEIQEPVLSSDKRIIFCAAVDRNGYLPTHNTMFSQPQSEDPIWNMAHCRNRRIFDDRVGLKAGQNTEPFLLQVYRREMGGGRFELVKDISAPICIFDKHWGGLRLCASI
ncbi:MAG: methyl-accepting chemotaxis protein [Pseudomonadota bacterium]